MTDDKSPGVQPTDETQPVRPQGAPADQAPAQPAAPATDTAAPATAAYAVPAAAVADPSARRGFRERFRRARSGDGNRAFSLGALVASALAGLIVGGLGVTAVHAIGHDGPDRGNVSQQRGPMGGDLDGPGGQPGRDGNGGPAFGQGGGMPGQVQPTTPPEDDDSGSSS
ncbi:hypothetical protein EUA93_11140 [Nocardioides oleivorans]|uniref:Uncharacterized protein n=1 Tax=Nocardioides oleivorans TaxID=273676 RepID=A0A4Q2S046_9ACTN|nr:hypothetical protein [Nocardioides oleivorans]RYB94857.1 hypothetical protein EUA93_11140 [Nocardioides oleivorans]